MTGPGTDHELSFLDISFIKVSLHRQDQYRVLLNIELIYGPSANLKNRTKENLSVLENTIKESLSKNYGLDLSTALDTFLMMKATIQLNSTMKFVYKIQTEIKDKAVK